MKKIICFIMVLLLIVRPVYAGYSTQNVVLVGALSAIGAGGIAGALLAFPPALPYVAAAVLIGAVAGNVYYSSSASSSSNKPYVGTNGDVSKPANVSWVDLVDNVPTLKTAPISAKVSYADIVNLTDQNAASRARYPNLYNATHAPNVPDVTINPPVGTIVKVGGNVIQVISVNVRCNLCGTHSSPSPPLLAANARLFSGSVSSGGVINVYGDIDTDGTYRSYSDIGFVAATAPKVPLQAYQGAQNLANVTSTLTAPKDVFSDKYAEIDDFIHSNPQVVHFEDGPASSVGSNPGFLTPPTSITDAQATNAVSANAAKAATGTTIVVNQTTFKNISAAAAANPSDSTLLAAKNKAAADLAAAKANDALVAAQQAKDALNTATDPGSVTANQNTYDTSLDSLKPAKSDISTLLTSFIQASPLITLVKSFTVDTSNQNSVLTFNYHSKQFTVDVGNWSSILAAVGSALLSVSHGVALFMVFRRD